VNLRRPYSPSCARRFETLIRHVHNLLMSYPNVATRGRAALAAYMYSSVYSAVSDAVHFAVSSHDGGAFAPC
jgi:hypothetical protein